MVKLNCEGSTTVFYFNTIGDCMAFKAVFKNHYCNVPWGEIETVNPKNIPKRYLRYIDEDPAERANNNLNWGFTLVKELGIGFTGDQYNKIQKIQNMLHGGK